MEKGGSHILLVREADAQQALGCREKYLKNLDALILENKHSKLQGKQETREYIKWPLGRKPRVA